MCSQVKSLSELELVLIPYLVGIDTPFEGDVLELIRSCCILKECFEHLHHFSNGLAIEGELTFSDRDTDVVLGVDNLVAEFITLGHKLFGLDVFSGEIHVIECDLTREV